MDRIIYIFLDIDGVLNNESAFELNYRMYKKGKSELTSALIDDQKLLILKDFCNQITKSEKSHNEYRIVISSSWRKADNLLSIIKEKLNEVDLDFIDTTPYCFSGERGEEIAQFCNEHNISKEDTVILDDDSDMADYHDRHIKTYTRDGLTYLDTEKALILLGLDDVVWNPSRFKNMPWIYISLMIWYNIKREMILLSDKLKIVIAGPRDFYDYDLVASSLVNILPKDRNRIQIVEGGATGVDRIARDFAIANKIEYKEFPANWSLGRKAGPIRNEQMARYADMLIAFDAHTRGTASMIRCATKEGLKITTFDISAQYRKELSKDTTDINNKEETQSKPNSLKEDAHKGIDEIEL